MSYATTERFALQHDDISYKIEPPVNTGRVEVGDLGTLLACVVLGPEGNPGVRDAIAEAGNRSLKERNGPERIIYIKRTLGAAGHHLVETTDPYDNPSLTTIFRF